MEYDEEESINIIKEQMLKNKDIIVLFDDIENEDNLKQLAIVLLYMYVFENSENEDMVTYLDKNSTDIIRDYYYFMKEG